MLYIMLVMSVIVMFMLSPGDFHVLGSEESVQICVILGVRLTTVIIFAIIH